jgi:predicted permease
LAGTSLIAALLIGVLPALRASGLNIQAVLRDGGRGTIGRRGHRRASVSLVAMQVALSVILLSAAGLLVRSFWNVSHRDLGYDPGRVVVAFASLPASTYPTVDDQLQFFERVSTGIKTIPGVEGVAVVDGLAGQSGGQTGIEIEGQGVSAEDGVSRIKQVSISPGYFATLGTAVLSGRDFADAIDTNQSAASVIVNRRFAGLHLPTGSVLGRRIRIVTPATTGPWFTIVGIAPDLHQASLTARVADPTIYRPVRQRPARGAWVMARTSLPPSTLIAPLRTQMQLADPALPIWLGPFTLDQWHAGTYWRRGLNGGLFALFAAMALLLACIGLCAVMAATVAQRRQELSVRRAIGATSGDVAWLVMRQGLLPPAAGLALGVIASIGTNRLLGAQLVDVAPTDPQTLIAVIGLIVAAVLGGCLPPVLQATRVDPLGAMRGD